MTRSQRRHHVEKEFERRRAGRIFVQKIKHRLAHRENLLTIACVIAGEGLERSPFLLVLGVLGQGRDLLARRHVLEFDPVGGFPSSGTGSLTGRWVSALARGEIVA